MYECIIGLTCFITGVLLMYAVHRVVFDYESDKAKNYIRKLQNETRALQDQIIELNVRLSHKNDDPNVIVEHMIKHTFETSGTDYFKEF